MSDRIAGALERIAAALEVLAHAAKEKENIPPTPPIREKETMCATPRERARKVFVKPSLAEVAAHVAAKGYTFDPEAFWNFYESKGWKVGSHAMKSWTSACVTWQKIDERRQKWRAHIDAKMDEREKVRLARMTSRRRADNYVGSTESQVRDFAREMEGDDDKTHR